jgi:hypothetical protein
MSDMIVSLLLDDLSNKTITMGMSGKIPDHSDCLRNRRKQCRWIGTDSPRKGDELDNVDAPFSTFDLGHIGLWLSQPLGKLLLCHAGAKPRLTQDGPERLIFFGVS